MVKAVDGVSLTVEPGQMLGVVGESGSGKSVSMLTVMGLTRAPNATISGSVSFEGRDLLSMLRRGPSHGEGQRHRDDLPGPALLAASLLQGGLPARGGDAGAPRHLGKDGAARDRAVELLGMVGIPDPRQRVDAYPHELSGRHAAARDDRDGARRTSPSC